MIKWCSRTMLRRFRRDRRGVTAVEFALLAAPFFALLFALLETCLVFFAAVSLETGMSSAARLIRTGQAQTGGLTREDIRDAVCEEMFLDCDSRLEIDVRTFDRFTNVAFTNPLDENGDLSTDTTFDMGEEGDIVLVRAFYAWRVLTPLLGEAMSNMNGDSHLLVASAAFRNEPFGELEEEAE